MKADDFNKAIIMQNQLNENLKRDRQFRQSNMMRVPVRNGSDYSYLDNGLALVRYDDRDELWNVNNADNAVLLAVRENDDRSLDMFHDWHAPLSPKHADALINASSAVSARNIRTMR